LGEATARHERIVSGETLQNHETPTYAKRSHDLTVGISRVYEGVTRHYGWPFELPSSSNFILSPHRRARPREVDPVTLTAEGGTGGGAVSGA
jgi:hypothetical protein